MSYGCLRIVIVCAKSQRPHPYRGNYEALENMKLDTLPLPKKVFSW